ncbi:MAG: hypothetical protein GTO18_16025 [Anaerolineales bacterium]|nr:hypothetical protein [Anaerolineales bacterium]
MNEAEQGIMGNSEGNGEGNDESKERIEILDKLAAGELEVTEVVQQLQGEDEQHEEMDVLEQLESGDIDVEKAIEVLQGGPEEEDDDYTSYSVPPPEPYPGTTSAKRSWWLIILASGLAITALGGSLAMIGGWWWLCAAPALLLGMIILLLAITTVKSPWLHVKVDTGEESWPQHINLSFPVPFRFASWGLRRWGHRFRGMDETVVDDLLIALEGSVSSDTPIYIDVQEDDDSGERVRVYLG